MLTLTLLLTPGTPPALVTTNIVTAEATEPGQTRAHLRLLTHPVHTASTAPGLTLTITCLVARTTRVHLHVSGDVLWSDTCLHAVDPVCAHEWWSQAETVFLDSDCLKIRDIDLFSLQHLTSDNDYYQRNL